MESELIQLIILLAATVIVTLLAVYSWRRRQTPGALSFAWLMLAVAEWNLTRAIAVISGDLTAARFWFACMFVGIAVVPVLLLLFTLEYTGRNKWLTRRNVVLLFVIPAATQLVQVIAPEWFVHNRLTMSGRFVVLEEPIYGPWFAVHTAYSYSLIALNLVLITLTLRSPQPYRNQATSLLIGVLASLLPNVLVTFKAIPPSWPLYALGFVGTGLIFAWAMFRYRLIDLMPMARDQVVDTMQEAFIVLDQQDRLVDLNPAAQAILGLPLSQAVGRSADQVFGAHQDLLGRLRDKQVQAEIALERGAMLRHYDLRISPLADKQGQLRGRLILLHDITERKRAEAAIQAALQKEMTLARNIQTSLLPPAAPNIPGLDIAALSLPAREVGGDLYTFYQLPDGGYGLAIGDVTGKGIPAALYMAVSTTMLEAKGPFIPNVAQLLSEMNTALLPHMQPNRMNIALCCVRLEQSNGSYTAHIANAGMVAPILRRGQQCEYLDVGGMPVGMTRAGLPYRVLTLPLQAGDILVLSSDGIIEAMNVANELYGFERLLARVCTAPQASAQEIQDWVLADVRVFAGEAEQHDDMTLIVLSVQRTRGNRYDQSTLAQSSE